ncbi:EF-hand domain-containing member C2 [Kappamyces sp. JEL0680]|nr:EF-hand domain-containing member C2 [Kappamyces sp. JEL0680]
MLDKDTIEQLQKQLPFLPGHSFDLLKTKGSERKSHAFDYCNEVPVFKAEAPGIGRATRHLTRGGRPLYGQSENKIHSSIDVYRGINETGETVPAWVAFDRKVLRFYGYFQEGVQERREEKYRIRRVNVYFYLEDDSVHVSEPKTPDSGIPQGTLIRRHRIPKQNALNGQHFTVRDFNVGTLITFYSRSIKLVGCDDFTREFLEQLSIRVPPNGSFPSDPYETQRKEMLSHMKATRPSIPNLTLKQFLENDRRVLRFYCVWDDSTSVFGDLRHMVLHYYLSDDTMEIKESIPPNSGRESNALFLRRCRLPKRPRVSNLSTAESKVEYFSEADLMIGSVIHLYGRPFVICDCDEFTKNYYRENYEIETFDPVRIEEFRDDAATAPFFDVSAHYAATGEQSAPLIGNESQAKKDVRKLLSYDGITLRFLAKLVSSKQVDRDRKFVISYHLANDTISIFEPRARNSGIIGGKFLENRKIKKPKSNQYYESRDFYIDAELVFFQHHFLITGADEYALKFMDANPELFPSHSRKPQN